MQDIQQHPFPKGTEPNDSGSCISGGFMVKHPPSAPIHHRGPQSMTDPHWDDGVLRKKLPAKVQVLLPST